MTAMPFDTLSAARKLRDSGIDPAHAEAIVSALADGMSESVASRTDLDKLRSGLEHKIDQVRADLERLEQRLDRRIDGLRTELEHKIDGVRAGLEHRIDRMGDRLTIRLGGMLVVGIGALAAIMRLI